MKKFITLVLVVVALQLGVVSASFAAPAAWEGDGGTYHTVRYGETLYSIGRYYGVNPHKIARANGLYNPNYIYAGQVLYIPSGNNGGPGQPGGASYHTVRYGETLYSIGRQYGVNPHKIAEVNGLYNPNYIYAGQVLYIPQGGGWGHNPGYGQPQPCQYDYPGNCGQGNHQPQPCQYDYPGNCGNNNYGSSYYGYDYTGYYYVGSYPMQKQYSYTCGYNHNCW
jgi:LysM repeat protein